MNACYADLGFVEAGSRVVAEISGPARVRLMEPEELLLQQLGGPTLCVGGIFSAGRVSLEVPEDGHWLHVIDVVNLSSSVTVSRASVQRRRRFRAVRRL
jgi:hypothetical protein